MKESINIFKNLKQNGEELDNSSWFSPAQIERNIIKKERKRFIIILILSNFFVWILCSNFYQKESIEKVIKMKKNHSVVQINADIHIPVQEIKKEITLIEKSGKFISYGSILPSDKQSPLTNQGPWKVEIPNKNITDVLNSKSSLKIIPKTQIQKSKKREINEIRF